MNVETEFSTGAGWVCLVCGTGEDPLDVFEEGPFETFLEGPLCTFEERPPDTFHDYQLDEAWIGPEPQLKLCDTCNFAFHLFRPDLSAVPMDTAVESKRRQGDGFQTEADAARWSAPAGFEGSSAEHSVLPDLELAKLWRAWGMDPQSAVELIRSRWVPAPRTTTELFRGYDRLRPPPAQLAGTGIPVAELLSVVPPDSPLLSKQSVRELLVAHMRGRGLALEVAMGIAEARELLEKALGLELHIGKLIELYIAGVQLSDASTVSRLFGLTAEQVHVTIESGFSSYDDFVHLIQNAVPKHDADMIRPHVEVANAETRDHLTYWGRKERTVAEGIFHVWTHMQAGETLEQSIGWAIHWRFTLSESEPWREAGIPWGHAGTYWFWHFSVDDACEWVSNGVDQPYEAYEWRKWCTPAIAAKWLQWAPMEIIARRWHDAGFDVDSARAWRFAGFNSDSAKKWADAGVTPDKAALRAQSGLQPPRQVTLGPG